MVKKDFELKEHYLDDFKRFNYPKLIHIIKFNAYQYDAVDFANIAVLEACSSFAGMSILTVVFTPRVGQDIPFVIVDYVKSKNNLTVFIEFYDDHMFSISKKNLFEERLAQKVEKYKFIDDYKENPAWYTKRRCIYSPLKSGDISKKKDMEQMIEDYLGEYFKFVRLIKKESEISGGASKNVKNEELQEFIEMLIKEGNPSSKIINKALGKEKSDLFYRNVVFCYK